MSNFLWEVLKKPFATSIELENSSLQTSEDKIDMALNVDDIDLPFPKRSRARYSEETVKYDNIKKVSNRIKEYRRISKIPEVSSGIDEIVSECITKGLSNTIKPTLEFSDECDLSDSVKKVYQEAWREVLDLLDFDKKGYDLFEKWYVEGRLVAESVYKDNTVGQGIQKVVILSPLNFTKVFNAENKEVYKYVDDSFKFFSKNNENEYDDSQITISVSGLKSEDYKFDVGYLDYILKTVNNMNTIEDSLVIYRFLRSVEKRIWNVPISRLGKSKAESYLTKVMSNIRNDKVFNKTTGEIKNSASVEAIIDDYVFPVKNGEKVEVDTINGDTSFINDLSDHELFLKKTYIGLKIPVNRLDETSTLDFSGEDVIKQELKFSKHTDRLLTAFGHFPMDILKKQLLATKKVSIDEWVKARKYMKIDWNRDNQVIKKINSSTLVDRANAMNEVENTDVIGKTISYTTVLKTIWDMTDDDIEKEAKLIEEEKKKFKFLAKEEENGDGQDENSDGQNNNNDGEGE